MLTEYGIRKPPTTQSRGAVPREAMRTSGLYHGSRKSQHTEREAPSITQWQNLLICHRTHQLRLNAWKCKSKLSSTTTNCPSKKMKEREMFLYPVSGKTADNNSIRTCKVPHILYIRIEPIFSSM